MSIAIAAITAGIAGVAATNIIGWLKNDGGFNIRNSVASGIIAFITAVPLTVTAFSAAFQGVESISQEAQLSIFVLQVGSIAGFDTLTKGGLKAAVKGVTKKGTTE